MVDTLAFDRQHAEQDRRLSEVFAQEKQRLRSFIRRHVPREIDSEDIMQDVFFELVEAYRLMKPVAHAGAWMMQVARNRITDLFRRRGAEPVEDGNRLILGDLLPSPDAGPDAVYARSLVIDAIEAALAELPASQREVFVAHEMEGRTFAELAAETGLSVNTLLSRKHYAVKHLRKRLRDFYEE